MKQTILTFLTLLTLSASAQKKAETPTPPPDTVKILSIAQLNRFYDQIKDKITARQGEDYQMVIGYIVGEAIKEFQAKK